MYQELAKLRYEAQKLVDSLTQATELLKTLEIPERQSYMDGSVPIGTDPETGVKLDRVGDRSYVIFWAESTASVKVRYANLLSLKRILNGEFE